MTPQSTKNRRLGSQNPPKIDPGTEKSILRDFEKILLFLKRHHDFQGPALPKINKKRPRAPSGGGQRVQERSGATSSSIFSIRLPVGHAADLVVLPGRAKTKPCKNRDVLPFTRW